MAEHQNVSKRKTWLSALISALATIVVAGLGLLSAKRGEVIPDMSDYTGLIRSTMDQPISGARVLFTEDESAPESSDSDSIGSFTIHIQQKTRLLHLEVSAPGYKTFIKTVQPHRTGPDVIHLEVLQTSAPAPSAQIVPPKGASVGASSGKPSGTRRRDETPRPAAAAGSQNCPNGICANGPIIGSPQINNYGPVSLPPRVIGEKEMKAALSVLHSHAPGYLQLTISGSKQETVSFYDQIVNLFASAGWTITRSSSSDSTFSERLPSGLAHDLEDEVVCVSPPIGASTDAALLALEKAGYPCTEFPTGTARSQKTMGQPDFQLTIRPRGFLGENFR